MIKQNHRTSIIIQTKKGNSGESENGYLAERICKRRRGEKGEGGGGEEGREGERVQEGDKVEKEEIDVGTGRRV